jgi:CO/xanthine dehydrogenase FAD-binding subunit
MGSYLRPTELRTALGALGAGKRTILAGGTDFYPARVGRTIDEDILDITALPLNGVEDRAGFWRIGALTTWSELVAAPLPPCFDGLKAAAREIGGVQIQNTGTIAGNLCNASPAADGIPPLLALEADVELAGAGGERCLPLGDFILGNRRTARRADELVTAIRVPKPARGTGSRFLKLGARRYLVISIAMVAIVIEPDSRHRVARARVAVGACSPAARRITPLEAALASAPLDGELGAIATARHLDAILAPIDDIRGSGAYRRDAALTLVRRGLSGLGAEMAAHGGTS